MRNDASTMRERFAANLRAFMAARGMSGKELADAADLTQAARGEPLRLRRCRAGGLDER